MYLHTFAFDIDKKGFMLKSENLAVYTVVEYFWFLMAFNMISFLSPEGLRK